MQRLISKVYIAGNRRGFVACVMAHFELLVVSGPSGSGKSTLLKKLMSEYPNKCGFSVSHTTRQPRPGEVEGKDYYFCQRDEMEKAIENGDFLEHAEYSGNLYGTSIKAVNDVTKKGKICILDVDRQGVKNVKETNKKSFFLFIEPPSMEVLENRLRKRSTESENSLLSRLKIAKDDIEFAKKPDSYDRILVNDDLEQAYIQFKEIFNKEIYPL